jgi:16S rRNA (guanine1207-N2)-methyltransferase
VLDLGCGTGVLAQAASQWGAREVLALDDDLAAVRASAANLASAPAARVVHADLLTPVTGDLGPLGFDAVWCNPPFHVGRQVEEGLSAAFVEGAMMALRPAGALTLVANRALRYEQRLAPWGRVEDLTPAAEGRYRVWRVQRER